MIKKSEKGFTLVELLVVIGILGILMGALFPAISSAMLSANTSAMSMRGRNLYVGITQANTERAAQGLTSAWPHQKVDDGLNQDDSEDIAGTAWNSASQYFQQLFNIEKYGKEDWSPFVTGVDPSVLWGCGVKPMASGGSLSADNVGWTVCSGFTDEMPDVLPVLITRNLPTDTFLMSGDNQATASQNDLITMGKKYPNPFGNKAAIVIHKGGGVNVVKSKYAKLSIIYDKQTLSFGSLTLKYLEP